MFASHLISPSTSQNTIVLPVGRCRWHFLTLLTVRHALWWCPQTPSLLIWSHTYSHCWPHSLNRISLPNGLSKTKARRSFELSLLSAFVWFLIISCPNRSNYIARIFAWIILFAIHDCCHHNHINRHHMITKATSNVSCCQSEDFTVLKAYHYWRADRLHKEPVQV